MDRYGRAPHVAEGTRSGQEERLLASLSLPIEWNMTAAFTALAPEIELNPFCSTRNVMSGRVYFPPGGGWR